MLQSTTLDFLRDLGENNAKTWFDENRDRYQAAKKDVEQLVNELIAALVDVDPGLLGLEAKQSMFRIFRDVRFSKDKVPYKSHMGAWMARGGRKSIYAGFYLHIEPGGKSMAAGGIWHPQGDVLKAVRDAIDYEPDDLRNVLADKEFKKYFPELEGSKLKTAPKGYPKDHPAIDLLRHKDLVVSTKLKDSDLTSKKLIDKLVSIYSAMYPLNAFLNGAIDHMNAE